VKRLVEHRSHSGAVPIPTQAGAAGFKISERRKIFLLGELPYSFFCTGNDAWLSTEFRGGIEDFGGNWRIRELSSL
jgi:hypothetical protein